VFAERVALALAALYALCGPLLGIESQVLTESLLLFLTALALFLWPKPGQPGWRHLSFGVVAGLLATGRGLFLLVPMAALVHFWIAQRSANPPAPGRPPEKSHKGRRSRSKKSIALASAAGTRAAPFASVLFQLAGLVLALLPLAIHQTRSVGSLRILTLNGGSKIEVETMLVMVSNTPLFGKNFLVAPEASLQDGLLDISVYPDFSKVELLRYYASVTDGGYSGDGKVQHYQARKLKIKTSPKLDIMADGIALGKGTVTIKVRPGVLRVIAMEKNPDLANQTENSAKMVEQPVSLPVGNDHHEENVIALH